MSMKPVPFPEPDPQVAAAVRAIWPRPDRQPLAVAARDKLGGWLRDEDFAAAFGTRGHPGCSPAVLALVTVLQQAENLTDRMAAENARRALDWKYALGLPLDDGGFDFSVLSEFRARVTRGEAADRLHACHRRGRRAEPAGAGRGERPGRAGGTRRSAPGLDRGRPRRELGPPLRDPADLLAAPGDGEEEGRAGRRLRP
jgi:hypothetical protein